MMSTSDVSSDLDIQAAILNLEENDQFVLLAWLSGYTQQEIADFLGISRPAVSKRIGRSIRRVSWLL